MPFGGGIALLAVGAILTFAVTGSIRGIDLSAVGVILMLAGALVFLLPMLAGSRSRSNRPPARSRQGELDEGIRTSAEFRHRDSSVNDRRTVNDRSRPWERRTAKGGPRPWQRQGRDQT